MDEPVRENTRMNQEKILVYSLRNTKAPVYMINVNAAYKLHLVSRYVDWLCFKIQFMCFLLCYFIAG